MGDTTPNPYVHPLYIPETDDREGVEHYGMTLRDYFAGQALAGTLAAANASIYGSDGRCVAAKNCYAMADAMLAERAKE